MANDVCDESLITKITLLMRQSEVKGIG